jgi:hypothetical protein
MHRYRTSLTPEALIEKIALETLPVGGELVWACAGGGPPKRGIVYRATSALPWTVKRFTALGRPYKLETWYDVETHKLLVTWSPSKGSRLRPPTT